MALSNTHIVLQFLFFTGEVIVWDTGKEDETRVASSGIGDDSHREPITKIQWVKDSESKSKKYNVCI